VLFRRVKNHVTEENWFAVFIDFMIVVLGVIIGFQITNWNENRSNAQIYDLAIERYKAEARKNIDFLNSSEENFLPFFATVPEAIDILLKCEDTPENLKKVELGINAARGSWGIKVQTDALHELRTNPILLAQQSPEIRETLSTLSSKLEILQVEAKYIEFAPLDYPVEFNPILKLGETQSTRNINYNGLDFTRKTRPIKLDVPLSEACQNDQLLKSLYIWEKWQRVIPVVISNMRSELEQSLENLAE